MRKGTHNSLTYSKLKNWWMYPFNWIAKCQDKTIQEQYEQYNIRDFDIRIRFNKKEQPYICHGLVTYKGDIENILKYIDDKGGCTVRLMLEKIKEKNDGQEELFIKFIEYVKAKYPNIIFWQFTRKYDFAYLYDSPYKEDFYDQNISSMNGRIWPRRWAKKHNSIATTDKELLLLDFIEYN